jgi:3-dehydroquinate synthase
MNLTKIHINDAAVKPGYDVIVGKNILSNVSGNLNLQAYSSVCIITDEHTKAFVEQILKNLQLKTTIITVPSGDTHKSIDTVQTIWQQMLDAKCDRKTLVINLGGGVIGDMGGFAASTFMRGVNFMQVPTSLLAQVDASVGGKVGINFHGIKNSIGSFQQPVAVLIDVATLASLPDRQFISGFGEIIKHGLIADRSYFDKVTRKKPREFSEEEMMDIISGSVAIKKKIIETDLTENANRKLVNFGHTYGHAIESMSQITDHPLMHGEAVSIGMVAESKLSQALGFLSEKDVQTITAALEHAGLPTHYKVTDKETLFKKMHSDKKNVGGKISWTLLKKIGEGCWDQELPTETIDKIINALS